MCFNFIFYLLAWITSYQTEKKVFRVEGAKISLQDLGELKVRIFNVRPKICLVSIYLLNQSKFQTGLSRPTKDDCYAFIRP